MDISNAQISDFKTLFKQIGSGDWLQLYQAFCFKDETELVLQLKAAQDSQLIHSVKLSQQETQQSIQQIRKQTPNLLQSLFNEYELNSEQGMAILTLAEAAIRIQDEAILDQLIDDQTKDKDWHEQLLQRHSRFSEVVNQGLVFTKHLKQEGNHNFISWMFDHALRQLSMPIIRQAISASVLLLAGQFVYSQRLSDITGSEKISIDMLGEAALSYQQSDDYFAAYQNAIKFCQSDNTNKEVSIKISALHPHYDSRHFGHIRETLVQRLMVLCLLAQQYNVKITFDAEESDRLELQLDLIRELSTQVELQHWTGLSVAVQAYNKACLPVLYYIAALAKERGGAIGVRLVKGAYWDYEIQQAQQKNLPDYPVFTQKSHTDMSYLIAAQTLLELQSQQLIMAKFATHNAFDLHSILKLAKQPCEFQRLHGMGQEVFDTVFSSYFEAQTPAISLQHSLRMYAPVGDFNRLLPYLIRRLVENSANQGFVFQLHQGLADTSSASEEFATPFTSAFEIINKNQPLHKPHTLFADDYLRAAPVALDYLHARLAFLSEQSLYLDQTWHAHSKISGLEQNVNEIKNCHFDAQRRLGNVEWCEKLNVKTLQKSLATAQQTWQLQTIEKRQNIIAQFIELLGQHQMELISLLQLEAGKTLQDAQDEFAEAIELLGFYVTQGKDIGPQALPNTVGECNELHFIAKGVVYCISPWNFPMAIFLGQIGAALLAGNAVVAKPAPQTVLIANRLIELLHQSLENNSISIEVVQLLICKNVELLDQISQKMVFDMVCFTGSNRKAHHIQTQLLNQNNSALNNGFSQFMAETSGNNVAIVEGSAYLDQVVRELSLSFVASGGQRCSCIRIVYVEQSLYAALKHLLNSHLQTLEACSPLLDHCDVPPIIDQWSWAKLSMHCQSGPTSPYIEPCIVELKEEELDDEYFGPILHFVPFDQTDIEGLIGYINAPKNTLTAAIFSRNQHFIDQVSRNLRAGNLYINRNSVGARVASQPFGGFGLSGSGEKAGGRDYLKQFVYQKTVTTNTAALGGDLSLLSKPSSD